MNKNIIAVLLILLGINLIKSQDVEQILIGTKHSLWSNILNENREYWVSLPDSYKDQKIILQNIPNTYSA